MTLGFFTSIGLPVGQGVLVNRQALVKDSFVTCAVTGALDGSDDDRIHCFKVGEAEDEECYVSSKRSFK